MGRLFLNNFLLDNLLFRLLRINRLFKILYNYEYEYAGEGIEMTVIDTDYGKRCNAHSEVMASLLVGKRNGFAKNAKLTSIGGIGCDGIISLSKLLATLEKFEGADMLVLPFSGPRSDILDKVLNRIGTSSIIVAAARNDGDVSCNYSPNGSSIIKVGSVNKHGYMSDFTNRGDCNRVYALGESVLGEDGTSYSTALVASAIAVFLSKYPKTNVSGVMRFLENNSFKNSAMDMILKTPFVDLNEGRRNGYTYRNSALVILVFLLII